MFLFTVDLKKIKKQLTVSVIALLVIIATVVNVMTVIGVKKNAVDAFASIRDAKVFVIDAGHGGEDSGAVSKNGVYEKDLNLEIAFCVGNMLKERGYNVVYTRTEDKLLYKDEENIKGIRKISDLKNRCKIASDHPEAIFLSIHMNSYGDSKYSGLQVYYSENNKESKTLADLIQASVKSSLQPENNRKIKEGKNIYVLKHVDNVAVLIECGFLSNTEECKKLSEKEYQKQLSFSIICGIIEYVSEK